MDDHTTASAESKPNLNLLPGESYRGEFKGGGGDNDETEEDEDYDMEVFDTLNNSFRLAQAALDQNRSLIKQVNQNHYSMIPENLTKNVSLICEINQNISKVISIYSDLSVNFSNLVQDRRRINNGNNVDRKGS